MPDIALKTHPPRWATNALGALLVAAGSIAALWRVLNLVSVGIVAATLPRVIVVQYFIANVCDVLWCGLMALSGYWVVKCEAKALTWLIASTVAWIPGTAVYAYQAFGAEFDAKALGISVGVLALGFTVFRVMVLLPNLAAIAVVSRQGATNARSSRNGPA